MKGKIARVCCRTDPMARGASLKRIRAAKTFKLQQHFSNSQTFLNAFEIFLATNAGSRPPDFSKKRQPHTRVFSARRRFLRPKLELKQRTAASDFSDAHLCFSSGLTVEALGSHGCGAYDQPCFANFCVKISGQKLRRHRAQTFHKNKLSQIPPQVSVKLSHRLLAAHGWQASAAHSSSRCQPPPSRPQRVLSTETPPPLVGQGPTIW